MPIRGAITSTPGYTSAALDIPSTLTVAFWHQNVNRAGTGGGGIREPFSWSTTSSTEVLNFTWVHTDGAFAYSFVWWDGSAYQKIQSSVSAQSTAAHRAFTFDGSTAEAFTDGGSDGTVTSTSIPNPSGGNPGFFAWGGGAGTSDWDDSDVSHAAIWDVVLTDAEITMLAAGYSPYFIRPASRLRYWPMWSTSVLHEVWGGNSLSAAGATSSDADLFHPLIMPRRRGIYVPTAVAGGGVASMAGEGNFTAVGAANASSVASVSGEGAISPIGASIGSSVFLSSGEASVAFVGASSNVAEGDFSAAGEASVTMVGASAAAGDLSAAGEAAVSMAGAAGATAALSIAGEAAVTLTGSSTASGVLNAAGEGDLTGVGASIAGGEGVLTITGESTVSMIGAAAGTGVFTSEGEAEMAMVSTSTTEEEEEVAVTPSLGTGGAWAKASSKRRRQVKREEDELVSIIKLMAPEIMNKIGRRH